MEEESAKSDERKEAIRHKTMSYAGVVGPSDSLVVPIGCKLVPRKDLNGDECSNSSKSSSISESGVIIINHTYHNFFGVEDKNGNSVHNVDAMKKYILKCQRDGGILASGIRLRSVIGYTVICIITNNDKDGKVVSYPFLKGVLRCMDRVDYNSSDYGISFVRCVPEWFTLSDIQIIKGSIDRSKIDDDVSGPNGKYLNPENIPSEFTIKSGMTYLYKNGTDCVNIERSINGNELDKYISEKLLYYKKSYNVSQNKF